MATERLAFDGFNPNIHGLRGLAALMVVLVHVISTAAASRFLTIQGDIHNKSSIIILTAGVDLFFMISGFLITASLIRHNNVASFLRDRAFRIYPAYLILIVPLFVLHCFGVKVLPQLVWLNDLAATEAIGYLGANLIFLPGLLDMPRFLPPAWTLSYEAGFYLMSAIIFAMLTRGFQVGLILVSGIIVPIVLYLYPRAVFFVVGAGVYAFYRCGYLQRIPAVFGIVGFIIFFTIMAEALPFDGNFHLGVYDYLHLFSPDHPTTERHFLAYPAALAGFFLFSDITRGAGWCKWFLQARITQFLGTISYSLYLDHYLVIAPVRKMVAIMVERFAWNNIAAFIFFLLLVTIVSIGVAWISYVLVEKTFTGWLRRKLRQPRTNSDTSESQQLEAA